MFPRNLRPIRLSRRSEPFNSDQHFFELKMDVSIQYTDFYPTGRHAGAIETITVRHLGEAQMVQLKNEPTGRSEIGWRAVAGRR